MDRWKLLAILCTLLLWAGLAPNAAADDWNKKTIVTFSAPVEIPGKVLPPGAYVFKLLDSASNRHIVQIFDKDEKQVYGTILAIPDYRLKPADKPVITFEERAQGSPEAIKAWFYPGDNVGNVFVYPKDKATELAKRTNQPVLSMPNAMAENMSKPTTSASDQNAVDLKNAEVKAIRPSGEEIEIIEVIMTRPPR